MSGHNVCGLSFLTQGRLQNELGEVALLSIGYCVNTLSEILAVMDAGTIF